MQALRWSVVLVVLSLFAVAVPVLAQELDGTYEDELIVFSYPTDWFFCECPPEEPVVIMGSTQAVVSTMVPQEGEVQLLIVKSVDDFLSLTGSSQDLSDLDAKGILQSFNNDSPIGIKAVPDSDAYYVRTKGNMDRLLMVIPLEDNVFGMLLATAPSGEIEPFIDTLFEIGISMHLPEVSDIELPTELEDNYRENGIRFNYPEDWIVEESGEMLLVVSHERLLKIDEFAELRDGEFMIFLYPTLDSITAETAYPRDIGDGNALYVAEFFAALSYRDYDPEKNVIFPEVDGRDAVAAIMTAEDHEAMLLTIDSEDGDDVAMMMVYGEMGNLEALRDLMMEMLGTIEAR